MEEKKMVKKDQRVRECGQGCDIRYNNTNLNILIKYNNMQERENNVQ